VLTGVKKNSDRSFDKLAIPINELIIPIYDERQVLTHFEMSPILMKLAYMKDYRNTDTIKEGLRTMILLNRVLLHDKTFVASNASEHEQGEEKYKLCKNSEVQTEFNDLIRNYFKGNILVIKSRIDAIPIESLNEQYSE